MVLHHYCCIEESRFKVKYYTIIQALLIRWLRYKTDNSNISNGFCWLEAKYSNIIILRTEQVVIANGWYSDDCANSFHCQTLYITNQCDFVMQLVYIPKSDCIKTCQPKGVVSVGECCSWDVHIYAQCDLGFTLSLLSFNWLMPLSQRKRENYNW